VRAKRQALNDWIRTIAAPTTVIDFDKATRDPAPAKLLPAYDSGDHLHPNDAGYTAMGNFGRSGSFKESTRHGIPTRSSRWRLLVGVTPARSGFCGSQERAGRLLQRPTWSRRRRARRWGSSSQGDRADRHHGSGRRGGPGALPRERHAVARDRSR
jgi:hypothetical protein